MGSEKDALGGLGQIYSGGQIPILTRWSLQGMD